MGFSEPGSGSVPRSDGEYFNPRDAEGHLLLVWAVDYVERAPTSANPEGDAIIVDVVDLHPGQGRLHQAEWWRIGRLIGSLRQVGVGNPEPVLAVMRKKMLAKGYSFELESMSQNPRAVDMANRWLAANRNFQPTRAQPKPPGRGAEPPAAAPSNGWDNTWAPSAAPPDPWAQQPQQVPPQGYQQPPQAPPGQWGPPQQAAPDPWARQAPPQAPPAPDPWANATPYPQQGFQDPYPQQPQQGYPQQQPPAQYAPPQAPPQQAPPQWQQQPPQPVTPENREGLLNRLVGQQQRGMERLPEWSQTPPPPPPGAGIHGQRQEDEPPF